MTFIKESIMKLKPLFIAVISTAMLASCANEEMRRQQAIDDSINRNVQDILLADKKLNVYPINVDTTDGNVYLISTVDTHEEADRATKKALSVKGVNAVKNELVVRKSVVQPKASSSYVKREIKDSSITTAVKAALLKNPDIHASDISVRTHNGTVRLSGTVPTHAEASEAINVAKGIRGVARVENEIEVQ
jgi:osmotically-inducible protein OsmY